MAAAWLSKNPPPGLTDGADEKGQLAGVQPASAAATLEPERLEHWKTFPYPWGHRGPRNRHGPLGH